jgi:hypothetical protein
MAGLNDLITDKKVEATTLPNWYDQAQQQTVAKAITAAPETDIKNTAAQSAIDAFGDGSSFTTGQSILKTIGEGAANPWIVSQQNGQSVVSPNVNTALGGLFKSQQDYLDKIMPGIDAATTAGATAGGGFGSRMNLSGIASARGNAAADLFQKQMQAALQNQQTGVSAGAGLGNITNQEVQAALNTGQYEQNAPYAAAVNMANIISKLQVPTTKTTSDKLGGLNQVLGLLNLTQGGLGSLLGSTKTVGGKQVTTPGLIEQIRGLYNKMPGAEKPTVSGTTEIFNPSKPGDESYGWKYYSDGTVIDPSGQYYDSSGSLVWSPYWDESVYDGGDSGLDLGGGDTSWIDMTDWENVAGGGEPSDNWDLMGDYDNWDLQ